MWREGLREQGTVVTICHFFLDVRLGQIQKTLYNYADGSEAPTEELYEDNYYETTYVRPQYTSLTPNSMFGMKP